MEVKALKQFKLQKTRKAHNKKKIKFTKNITNTTPSNRFPEDICNLWQVLSICQDPFCF